MAPSSGELYDQHVMPHRLLVDCLLPYGIMVPLQCDRDSTLEKIKEDLWKAARNYPLACLLGELDSYIFSSITQDAKRAEFYNETLRLCDLSLFRPTLKVVEPKGNKEEKITNSEVGAALGVAVKNFDEMKDPEVQDFRRSIIQVCVDAVEERDKYEKESQARYLYPPEVESSPELPKYLEEKLNDGHLELNIWSLVKTGDKEQFKVLVQPEAFPETVIHEFVLQSTVHLPREKRQKMIYEQGQNSVLKVCGCDDYFLGRYPMSQYKYIRQCLSRSESPELMLMSKSGVYINIPDSKFTLPSYARRNTNPTTQKTISLWNELLLEKRLRIHVLCATYVNVKEADMIYVKLGIFHGTEPLCEVRDTSHVVCSNPKWEEWVVFDLHISDLPRGAKLCVSVCSVTKRKKREELCMIAWGNVVLFDYKDRLLSGKVSLSLWPVPRGMDDLLYPLGITGTNSNRETTPCVELEFEQFPHPVCFPDMQEVEDFAKFLVKLERHSAKPCDMPSQEDFNVVKEIVQRDPLSEISEQEKELIMRLRYHCRHIPESLPKLLDAMKWYSRDDLAQLYVLLKSWPIVTPETALELLDCKYADPLVRRFAVQCLEETFTDDNVFKYLLQLVQTLKFEPYFDSDLARFLVRRGLINRKIGHCLFWHLKSEMYNPMISVRFGLLLEAYCRGLGDHIKTLNRQVKALDKLTKLSDSLWERKDDTQKDRSRFLKEQIAQDDYMEALQNFPSPLNNAHVLGDLSIHDCRIMDSAKRPLWLVWNSCDPMKELLYEQHAIIFKNGDDLRQDMLTIQVIGIMDSIWQSEGMDLRMMPYTCLATGKDVGMIEVVRKAKTVYGIQRQAGKLAAIQVDSTQLHKWIKERNKGYRYEQAIDTFTLSCAGYCVATFILGIGDRNPDNIMVNEEGQIFHIDFGHFLGHFKKKFGINRERVPFVLTEDFLNVITRGAENPKKSKEFQEFMELCGKAYLVMHRHANLLITLFMMMLPTGIPELQSIDDIEYLRKTLAVEKMEEEALEYFQSRFCEAHGGAWTTKLDWFFHSVKHM